MVSWWNVVLIEANHAWTSLIIILSLAYRLAGRGRARHASLESHTWLAEPCDRGGGGVKTRGGKRGDGGGFDWHDLLDDGPRDLTSRDPKLLRDTRYEIQTNSPGVQNKNKWSRHHMNLLYLYIKTLPANVVKICLAMISTPQKSHPWQKSYKRTNCTETAQGWFDPYGVEYFNWILYMSVFTYFWWSAYLYHTRGT